MPSFVRANFQQPGIIFFTENELSQQLAYMRHPSGKIIQPHIHNPVPREVHYTQEVLFIRRGVLRVDFYDSTQQYIESHLLKAGDTILLAAGGHDFEVIEEVEMLEVKQGRQGFYIPSGMALTDEGTKRCAAMVKEVLS